MGSSSFELPLAETADLITPTKNVTAAVNYELSMVDQFMASDRKKRSLSDVETVGEATSKLVPTKWESRRIGSSRSSSNLENHVPNSSKTYKENNDSFGGSETGTQTPQPEEMARRSAREKRKEVPLARVRVRYDMQMVPAAKRNRAFLDRFPQWWLPPKTETEKPRRSSRLTNIAKLEKACEVCHGASLESIAPFLDDNSIIWIPSKRVEWEDTVSEMTSLCTSAAIRRHVSTPGPSGSKPFHAPLSRDYIRDRVDIDDPINGYQLRHRTGGWLQGFVMWTNFTSWTHYFKWDSRHPISGFSMSQSSGKVDLDGSLADQLESQPRSGDPLGGGVVFEGVAELSLLGGLGCGEYLLRMALDNISSTKMYKFLVLQATDASKSFYERFGFVRVGAICRYGAVGASTEDPVMGYRHWTHANESETSLQLHGGPSYMMCLKLPEVDTSDMTPCNCLSEGSSSRTFLDAMLALRVDLKPMIEQLGASATPGPKPGRKAYLASFESPGPAKRKPGKRGIMKASPSPLPSEVTALDRPSAAEDLLSPPPKKRKYDGASPSLRKSLASPGKSVPHLGIFDGLSEVGRPVQLAPRNSTAWRVGRPLSPKPSPSISSQEIDSPPMALSLEAPKTTAAIEKWSFMKQKVKSYPRSRVHFYNRVVKPKKGPVTYYFVVYYDETNGLIRIVPMAPRGTLSGKREGRPRYQACIGDTEANFKTAVADDYQVVNAVMVMKTPVIASEAWDIEE